MFYWHPIGCTKEMTVVEQIKVTLCHCSQAKGNAMSEKTTTHASNNNLGVAK